MIEFQLPNLVRQSLPVTPIEQGLLGSAVITSLFYSSSLGVAFGASYAAYKVYQTALADRNAISFKDSNIERSTQLIAETLQSPKSTEIDLSQIPPLSLPEAQKIEELAKRSDCIAITRVQNLETFQWELAYIKKTPDGYPGRDHFGIYNFQDECLGTARVDLLPLSNPKTLDRWDTGVPRRLRGYGPQKNPEMIDKIELYSLYTKDNPIQKKYKYTGYALLKSIEAQYRDRYEGRTILDSKPGAIGFYYKLGFRSADEAINEKIAKIIANANIVGSMPNTESLGKIPMFLPNHARAEWQKSPSLPTPADVLAKQ